MNITEFLEARIAEDEALAKAADSGRWLPEDKGVTFEFYGDEFPDGEAQSRLTADTKANMWHIARHDPARVLAECAAKRALIAWVGRISERAAKYPNDDAYVFAAGIVSRQLEYLAYAYKDHPDYQREWAVGVRVGR